LWPAAKSPIAIAPRLLGRAIISAAAASRHGVHARDHRTLGLAGQGAMAISPDPFASRPNEPFKSMTERTLSIIKPDATARNLTGRINALIEDAGLRIVAQRRIRMSRAAAERFYAVHEGKPFYGELVEMMTSGPVVVQVLEGKDAVANYRRVMGATNPRDAEANTIRKLYALSIGENSVHGSDSQPNAAVEIAQFFTQDDIVG
jgi:nucleoside-diphosphate kinase